MINKRYILKTVLKRNTAEWESGGRKEGDFQDGDLAAESMDGVTKIQGFIKVQKWTLSCILDVAGCKDLAGEGMKGQKQGWEAYNQSVA